MKIVKEISVGRFDPDEKGVDLTRDLGGDERVSMVEDLRIQMAKVTRHEYPGRLRRVLEITHRISYDDLLVNKRASGRLKDLADFDELGGDRARKR